MIFWIPVWIWQTFWGADAVINSKEEGYQKQALELTEGKGFDYVFETAGNPVTMQMGFELAGNKAKVCFIGTPHVDMTFTPKLWENMNRKEFKLTGSWMSYSSPVPRKGMGADCSLFRYRPAEVRPGADL